MRYRSAVWSSITNPKFVVMFTDANGTTMVELLAGLNIFLRREATPRFGAGSLVMLLLTKLLYHITPARVIFLKRL
jgi:phage tail sheath gpL-like